MKIDSDVKEMGVVELRQEVMRLRIAFRKELDHTGNHRCWINLLTALPEGRRIEPLSMNKEGFIKNCERYFDRNQPKKNPGRR